MNYEDMTVGELEAELERLEDEKRVLKNNWMVDDPDDEWGQIIRDIDRVVELLNHRRSV